MEFLNEVWDTLKEIAESKMNEIFAGHKDNKGQLDYGRFETFFSKNVLGTMSKARLAQPTSSTFLIYLYISYLI